jgi:hypothetical protein
VDQLGAPLRRRRGDVVLFDDQNGQPPAGSVAGDAGAVDAGADDDQIVGLSALAGHGRKPDDGLVEF